jgi:U4/U6 small nuclear ribonucleoprotein PRP4
MEVGLPLGRLIDVRRAVFADLKTITNLGSQIGDTRALSSIRFSPDSTMLLTSSWTGHAKIWNVPACKEIKTLKGGSHLSELKVQGLTVFSLVAHKERIGGVAWHPQATLSQSPTAVNFATSSADNDIKLWGLDG